MVTNTRLRLLSTLLNQSPLKEMVHFAYGRRLCCWIEGWDLAVVVFLRRVCMWTAIDSIGRRDCRFYIIQKDLRLNFLNLPEWQQRFAFPRLKSAFSRLALTRQVCMWTAVDSNGRRGCRFDIIHKDLLIQTAEAWTFLNRNNRC